MQKWQYAHLPIFWDTNKEDFYATPEKEKVYGIGRILDAFGEYGWELVNILPAHSRGDFGFAQTRNGGDGALGLEMDSYRAVFKRPKA